MGTYLLLAGIYAVRKLCSPVTFIPDVCADVSAPGTPTRVSRTKVAPGAIAEENAPDRQQRVEMLQPPSRYSIDDEIMTCIVQDEESSRLRETQAMKSVAAAAVLATPELLEMILLEFVSTQLLTPARNVSATWRAVVDTSPAIRAKLMIAPPLSKSIPLVPELHDPFLHYDCSLRLNPAFELLKDWVQEPVESPWGFGIEKIEARAPRTSVWDGKYTVVLSRMPNNLGNGVVNGVWRDLLLTEPAVSVAHAYVAVNRSIGPILCQKVGESVFCVRDEDGLRRGLVEDLVLVALKQIRDPCKMDSMTGSLTAIAQVAFRAHVED